jgi:hypothetical protein
VLWNSSDKRLIGYSYDHDFHATRASAHGQMYWFRHQSMAFATSFANALTQLRGVQLVTRSELSNRKCSSCFLFGDNERQ